MISVGDRLTIGQAEFVVEQAFTGQVLARCVRPDPTNALAYQPHQLYTFGPSTWPVGTYVARPTSNVGDYGPSPLAAAYDVFCSLRDLVRCIFRRPTT